MVYVNRKMHSGRCIDASSAFSNGGCAVCELVIAGAFRAPLKCETAPGCDVVKPPAFETPSDVQVLVDSARVPANKHFFLTHNFEVRRIINLEDYAMSVLALSCKRVS